MTTVATIDPFRYIAQQDNSATINISGIVEGQVTQPEIGIVRNGDTATVTITCSTPNYTGIFYGINGAPITTLYTMPFIIDISSTIRAFATKTGLQDSTEATTSYEFILPLPTISPLSANITIQTPIHIACVVTGASVFYTTNGDSPTNIASPTNIQFFDDFALSHSATIKAKAFKTGWTTPQESAAKLYNVTQTSVFTPYQYQNSGIKSLIVAISQQTTAAPIFEPNGGTITSTRYVTITSEPGAIIYWTDSDAEALNTSSRIYSSPISVSASVTLRAFAKRTGKQDSTVAQARFEFLVGNVDPPVATPQDGTYAGAISVDLRSTTPQALIYYTVDGTVPYPDPSRLYNSSFGIQITEDTTVKAIAWKQGMIPSSVVELNYHIITETKAANPVISPAGGNFIVFTDVVINTATSGATIYYSTDGSNPSASSPTSAQYTLPIHVDHDQIIRAVAIKQGLENSDVASAVFYIQPYLIPSMLEASSDDMSLVGGSAIVKWQISDANGVTGFIIRYGTESGLYGYAYNVTNPGIRTATINNLSNGVRYYFSIVAMYGAQESSQSNEVSCLVRDVHAPEMPSDFVATITGDGMGILLKWKNPSNDFDHVVLVKNANHVPTSISDGDQIYSGSAEEFIDRNI